MNVLVTGPSCSGKTVLARSLKNCRLVQLDRFSNCRDCRQKDYSEEIVLYEGIPSGSEPEIEAFLGEMDLILLLRAPFEVRLRRMVNRDGPAAVGRFLYNEFAWRRYLNDLLSRVRRIEELQVDDAAQAVRDAEQILGM